MNALDDMKNITSSITYRLIAGAGSVLLSAALTAAVLYRFQDDSESMIRITVQLINAPAGIALVAFRSYFFAYVVFVVQWFLVGYFVMWIYQRLSRHRLRD